MHLSKLSTIIFFLSSLFLIASPNKNYEAFMFDIFLMNEGKVVQINDLQELDYDNKEHKTLLLMGGIQGDEPGGFNATNIFLMRYKVNNGKVVVVPVLNKHSMILNHRGIYGDMNRKFATLNKNDPEYEIIEKIKKLINIPSIDIIFHLHDGSGFYRPTFVNNLLNPNRWGNCSIIDQINMTNHVEFGDLENNANKIIDHINSNLLKPFHKYHIHNTKTADGDKEMLKALTFYAISNNKPAYANEASKELKLPERVYYHLLAIEKMMHIAGIEFERDFELTPNGIRNVLYDKNLNVVINENNIFPLFNLRPNLNYIPLPKNITLNNIKLKSDSKILTLSSKYKNEIIFKYGNRVLTRFTPIFLDFDNSLESLKVNIDDSEKEVKIGSMIKVKNSIKFLNLNGYRINIIGFVKKGDNSKKPNEMGYTIKHSDFIERFSIDRSGLIFRAEVYKGDMFSGNILIDFSD